jgi:hypothetical protein
MLVSSQLIYLTDEPVRVTGPNVKQDLRLAIDVGAFDQLDLGLVVYEGTDVSLRILTGMQVESDLGWLTADTFALTQQNGGDKMSVTGLLRYVRWELVSSGTATFMIAGIARSSC